MRIKKITYFALLVLALTPQSLKAQANLDSLYNKIINLNTDTETKIDTLIYFADKTAYENPGLSIKFADAGLELITAKRQDNKKSELLITKGWAYLYSGNLDKAIEFTYEANQLAKTLENNELIGTTYNQLGVIYYYKGDYEKTEEYWILELEYNRKLNDQALVAQTLSNLGIISKNNGNYDKAIENYQNALQIQEGLNDSLGMARSISNLGNIYFHFRGNYKKALENYTTGLALYKALNENESEADILNNMGLIYDKMERFDLAEKYLDSALTIFMDMGNEERIFKTQGHLGTLYSKTGDFELAEEYCNNYLNYYQKIGNRISVGLGYNQLGNVYLDWGKYYKAYECFNKSIKIFKTEKLFDELVFSYQNIAKTNYHLDNFKQAYKNHVRYSTLKDSLFSVERQKQISELETKYETEKKERQIELLNKDKALQDATLKRQKLVIWFFVAGFIAVAFFAIIILRLFRQKQKANIALEEKNHKISMQRDQIFQQKEEITSSIEYASKIQTALLPPQDYIDQLIPDSFIFFRPRDIVSGDFYWLNKKGNKIISVTADCTGHGVPGAFMSMLGISFLNEIVNIRTEEQLQASEILNELRALIISSLRQEGKIGESRDGMDLTICIIDYQKMELEYAGAYNPLYLIRNNELIEYKADKMPIGIHIKELKPFTSHTIQIQENDVLYTFSDGYADQFGGPKDQKYRRKNFKNLLLEINQIDMQEQKDILGKTIDEWMEGYAQVDDILVSGIRISKK